MSKSIAIISDIHIGPLSRSKDLVPPGCNCDNIRDERFIDAFEKFASTNSLSANYLIIAGDLSSKALADEFQHASVISERIADSLSVPHDQIIYVPGNHDVDWSVLKLASSEGPAARDLRWKQRYQPITTSTGILSNRFAPPHASNFEGNLFDPPFTGVWSYSDSLFVAINSAAHDRPEDPIHHGFIRQEAIDWIRTNIPKRASDDHNLRCLVLHHHLVPHGNRGHDQRDFSTCQNADILLELLRDLEFDLVVHGHKHLPQFQTQLIGSDHPVLILGAGSFSADLTDYAGSVHNQFHLLNIEGRTPQTRRIFGGLQNWAYVFPSGWKENTRDYTVVDHRIGFGGPLNWRDIVSELHTPIQKISSTKDIFSLDEIAQSALLRYVSLSSAEKAIHEIANLENLDVTLVLDQKSLAYFRRKG